MIVIKEPRWKDRSLLIAYWKVEKGINLIQITAEDADGNYRYPGIYRVDGSWLKQFPVEKKSFGNMLIIPLNKFLEQEHD